MGLSLHFYETIIKVHKCEFKSVWNKKDSELGLWAPIKISS